MAYNKMLNRLVLVVGSLSLIGLPQLASATAAVPCETGPVTNNIMSCSTGLYADLSVLDTVTLTTGPEANSFGSAPPAYSVDTQLVSVNAPNNLILGTLALITGVIVDTASSPYNGPGPGAILGTTATSTVSGLGIGLEIPSALPGVIPPIDLLTLTSGIVSSTTYASELNGVIYTQGTSEVEDLVITVLGSPAITINPGALGSLPINDVLAYGLGFDVIANEQTPIYDGPFVTGLQTAALAINFDGFALGAGLLNGEILVADTAASVPEPGTWAMALAGLGLIGMATRRQRVLALA